jgi:hypothetical protein
MSDKVTWKKLNSTSVQDYEAWISEMDYAPYVYDPVLQSFDWVKDLTKAIEKVRYMVGEGADIEYLYWDKLRNWEFILNCFSIARVFGGITITGKKFNWESTLEEFRYWVDSILNHTDTRDLYQSGTSFFYDMHLFFKDNRKLSDPKMLAKEVLAYKK